jgi:hypothetical protein
VDSASLRDLDAAGNAIGAVVARGKDKRAMLDAGGSTIGCLKRPPGRLGMHGPYWELCDANGIAVGRVEHRTIGLGRLHRSRDRPADVKGASQTGVRCLCCGQFVRGTHRRDQADDVQRSVGHCYGLRGKSSPSPLRVSSEGEQAHL